MEKGNQQNQFPSQNYSYDTYSSTSESVIEDHQTQSQFMSSIVLESQMNETNSIMNTVHQEQQTVNQISDEVMLLLNKLKQDIELLKENITKRNSLDALQKQLDNYLSNIGDKSHSNKFINHLNKMKKLKCFQIQNEQQSSNCFIQLIDKCIETVNNIFENSSQWKQFDVPIQQCDDNFDCLFDQCRKTTYSIDTKNGNISPLEIFRYFMTDDMIDLIVFGINQKGDEHYTSQLASGIPRVPTLLFDK